MKLLFSTLVVLLFTIGSTHAQNSEIFAPGGKAIKGYDPVAFFKNAEPIKGKDSISYTWKDAKWLFVNRENMESFKADPERFAPQYGGYCAYGTADGHKAPTQTETWTIIDKKLYFNYSNKVKELWNTDQKRFIEKADKNWIEIKDKP